MDHLRAFIRLSRLHFLAGGLLLFALGSIVAGDVDTMHYVVAQAMITSAQLTAHYLNEYADLDADRGIENATWFSGGSGVLPSGRLAPIVALRAGQVTTALAIVTALGVAQFSVTAAVTGLLCLGVSWAYSMPPVRLLNTGWGEVATAITVAGLVPVAGSVSQSGTVPAALWWMIAALTVLQLAMLLAFEIPDVATDAAAGKRPLAVRIGVRSTVRLITMCTAASGVALLIGRLVGALDLGDVVVPIALLVVPVTSMIVAMQRRRHALTTASAVSAFFLCAAGLVLTSA